MADRKYGYCSECNEVFVYEQYADGDTDIDRGEFLVHRQYMQIGFKTQEAAGVALDARNLEDAEEAAEKEMATREIPQKVIEALAKARERGAYNMFDRKGVTEYVMTMISEDAGEWLTENKARYMDALNAMGEYISKPKTTAPTDSTPNVQNRAADNGESSAKARKSVKKTGVQIAKETTAAMNAALLEIGKPSNQRKLDNTQYAAEGIASATMTGLAIRRLIVPIEVTGKIMWVRFTDKGNALLKRLNKQSEPAAAQTSAEYVHVSHDGKRHLWDTGAKWHTDYDYFHRLPSYMKVSKRDEKGVHVWINEENQVQGYLTNGLFIDAAQPTTANEAGTGDVPVRHWTHEWNKRHIDAALNADPMTRTVQQEIIISLVDDVTAKDATIADLKTDLTTAIAALVAVTAERDSLRAALEEMKVWIRKADVNVQPIRLVIEPMIDKALAKLKG